MPVNPKSIENLQPPKPGEIRNPKGRGKGVPNAKTRYQRILNLIEKVKNPVTGDIEDFTVAEIMDMKIMQKARNGDLAAYKEIMDRLEGKASQSVDVTSDGEKISNIVYMPAKKPEDYDVEAT